jgi:hypothetical protein
MTKIMLSSVALLFAGAGCVIGQPQMRDAKDRFAQNIVPQPKIVQAPALITTLNLLPEEITIVYGKKSPKTRIGAEEFNKELLRRGFTGKMKIISDNNYKKSREKFMIIIGSPSENILSKSLWGQLKHSDELNVLKDKTEGYIIEGAKCGEIPALILAGVSPQGSLYAAISLAQMFIKNGKKVEVPSELYVKDWPDFNWRYICHMTHIFGQSNRTYKYAGMPYVGNGKIGKEYIDWALKYKINFIGIKFWLSEKELLPILEYAKQRGIFPFTFYPRPSIAVCKAKEKNNNPKYKELNNIYRNKYYISWSRDDLLKPLYTEFAKKCKKYGVKFVWFHTADTGLSSLNYAQWNYRDKLDKENFGNDYGKADVHVIDMIYEIFQKESPDTKITYVTYPYTASVLADDFPQNIVPDLSGAYAEEAKTFIRKYFKTFSEKTPKSIYTCLRETKRSNVEKWLEATKRPILLYFETCKNGYNLISSRPRYIKTFYFKDYDNAYFYPSIYESFIHGVEIPVEMLLNAEYCWNVNQKGAAYFDKYDFTKDLTEPKVVFDEIVPRCARAYWGPEAGKYFAPLFQTGIVPGFIENPMEFQRTLRKSFVKILEISGNLTFARGSEIFFDGAAKEMRKQHSNLEKALPPLNEWMENYQAKKLDSFSYKYGTMFWLLAHYWHCKAAIWAPILELQNHIINGNSTEAKAALQEAQKAIKTAKTEINKALGEIKGKHLCLMPKFNKKPLNEGILIELEKLEAKCKELEAQTKQIGKPLTIDDSKLNELKSKVFIAAPSVEKAKPYSNFTAYAAKPARSAFYQSEVQIYYDSKNLYIKAKMLDAKGHKPICGRNKSNKVSFWSKGKEENDLEIFLAPPKNKFFYQLACDPLGKKFSVRIFGKFFKRDYSWKCNWDVKTSVEKGFWTVLATIPFSSLGAKAPQKGETWKLCIARQRVGKSGSTVFSTITPGATPNKPTTYPNLVFK